ncbi:MAG: helix-turn-helix transcriptional regulator [Pyrinomonadaceae bacterium]|nr:helix-turn-helix transcriptional regulator [Pyrinomonadaceae bacterium]
MGKASVEKPNRLAEKLLSIRLGLNLSQNELIQALGYKGELTQSQISAFERGSRIPSLIVLLKYSYLISVHLEILVDDSLILPEKLPSKPNNKTLKG